MPLTVRTDDENQMPFHARACRHVKALPDERGSPFASLHPLKVHHCESRAPTSTDRATHVLVCAAPLEIMLIFTTTFPWVLSRIRWSQKERDKSSWDMNPLLFMLLCHLRLAKCLFKFAPAKLTLCLSKRSMSCSTLQDLCKRCGARLCPISFLYKYAAVTICSRLLGFQLCSCSCHSRKEWHSTSASLTSAFSPCLFLYYLWALLRSFLGFQIATT